MRIGSNGHRAKRLAMTPLIDIVFILLLFFILETSFSQFRELSLTRAEQPLAATGSAVALRLDIFADGRIWVAGQSLRQESLDAFLRQQRKPAGTPVLLALAGGVDVQSIVAVCDVLHRNRLRRIEMRALETLP